MLATEVVARQGIADAVLGKGSMSVLGEPGVAKTLDSYTNAKVLSLLNGAPRSIRYLSRKSRLPGWRVSRTLEALEKAHLVERDSSRLDGFVLSDVLRFH